MVKQVIVMRKDLNMRKGKMISQGAHAASAFMLPIVLGINKPTYEQLQWIQIDLKKKITVYVNSEKELLDIYQKARDMNLEVNIITDAGLTEFNNIPTKTCLAIGPNYAKDIDKITGNLKLL